MIEVSPVQLEINTLVLDGKKMSKALFEQFDYMVLNSDESHRAQSWWLGAIERVVCTHNYVSKKAERIAVGFEDDKYKRDHRLKDLHSDKYYRFLIDVDNVIFDVLYDLAEHRKRIEYLELLGDESDREEVKFLKSFKQKLAAKLSDAPHIYLV